MAETLKLTHKIVFDDNPPSLTKLISYSLQRSDISRLSRKPFMIQKSNTSKLSQSVLFRAVFIYNKLSDTIRHKNTKVFSKNIGKYLYENFPLCDIPKTDHG